ncbi:hypothetical protein D3C79_1021380 [compost metagenome]
MCFYNGLMEMKFLMLIGSILKVEGRKVQEINLQAMQIDGHLITQVTHSLGLVVRESWVGIHLNILKMDRTYA